MLSGLRTMEPSQQYQIIGNKVGGSLAEAAQWPQRLLHEGEEHERETIQAVHPSRTDDR